MIKDASVTYTRESVEIQIYEVCGEDRTLVDTKEPGYRYNRIEQVSTTEGVQRIVTPVTDPEEIAMIEAKIAAQEGITNVSTD